MNSSIRIKIYKILRKVGVSRVDIQPEAKLKESLITNRIDWMIFIFLLESRFNISLSQENEGELKTVDNTIRLMWELSAKN